MPPWPALVAFFLLVHSLIQSLLWTCRQMGLSNSEPSVQSLGSPQAIPSQKCLPWHCFLVREMPYIMRLHSLCSFDISWAHYFNDIQYSTVYYTFTVRESPAESTVGKKTAPLQGEQSRQGTSQDRVAGSRIYSYHRA